jgi:SnoaL-like domain
MSALTDEMILEHRVRATLLRYIRGIDRADPALRLSAFAPQGKMFMEGVQVIGPGATERAPDKPPAPGLPPRDCIIAMTHHLAQVEIRGVGTRYAVESETLSYLVIAERDQHYMLVRGIRYHDIMSEHAGEILIDERQHLVDWMLRAPELFNIPTHRRHSFADFVEGLEASR